ncbi:hypothetical protein M3Y98_01213700 [Aphelenchoides besseyi]|nr:hypothetical protein M3Y98_01213700 [Aphelenchoides besseyi]
MFTQKMITVFVVVGVLMATFASSAPVDVLPPVIGEVVEEVVGEVEEIASGLEELASGASGSGAEITSVIDYLIKLLEKELNLIEGSGSGLSL